MLKPFTAFLDERHLQANPTACEWAADPVTFWQTFHLLMIVSQHESSGVRDWICVFAFLIASINMADYGLYGSDQDSNDAIGKNESGAKTCFRAL